VLRSLSSESAAELLAVLYALPRIRSNAEVASVSVRLGRIGPKQKKRREGDARDVAPNGAEQVARIAGMFDVALRRRGRGAGCRDDDERPSFLVRASFRRAGKGRAAGTPLPRLLRAQPETDEPAGQHSRTLVCRKSRL
jgi:hypothetical protein